MQNLFRLRTFLCLALAAALLVLPVGCKKGDDTGPAKVSVRLQWFPTAQFAGFYLAKQKGYYADQKLDVALNPGGPDFSAITLVTNRSDTLGVWTADQILISASKGVPVTIVAAIYRKDPNVLLVRHDSAIKGPKDFVGKTVTTVYGRATETVLKAMLQRQRVDAQSVKIEPFPFTLQSFAAGQVDVSAAYSYDHPFQAKKLGLQVRVIDPADYGVSFYSDCLFVRTDLIESNPRLVERFVHATLRGWEQALSNKEDAVKAVLAEDKSLDRDAQMYMLEHSEPLIRHEDSGHLGLISEKSLEQMKSVLVEQGQMRGDFNVGSAFTNRFVESYYAERSK